MPRDDLSIDFVKRMPPGGEALDPALILDDWINRVQNLPEEIRFLQDEIADKDRQYNECIRIIEERDGRIQKFIKANSSHDHNPREEGYRKTIIENFKKAEVLADEKLALSQKMRTIMDRHTRQLDMQIKQLYDRSEPGFTDPDELPSLLRPSAANKSAAASARASAAASSSLPAASVSDMIKNATKAVAGSASLNGGGAGNTVLAVGGGRGAGNAQARQAQAQAQQGHSSSAPASPAASMILGRQARESSAGPGTTPAKRGPRAGSSLANIPPASSGLARHSSLGPGTPKSHHAGAGGVQRAGSAGPRAIAKGAGIGPGRKGSTPAVNGSASAAAGPEKGSGSGRKKGTTGTNTPTTKTSLSRVKRPAKASAASSTADESELSDASSSDDSDVSSRHATPTRGSSQVGASSNAGSASNGNGTSSNGNGAGNKEAGASQPLVKREKDNSIGISSSVGNASGNAGGQSGPGSGPGGPGRGGVNKHRAGDKPGGRGVAKGAPSSDDRMDIDDEEAGDDNKYCLCQNVSFGDMVACDNEDCPFEWFHWTCVGLKSEPNGTWYCPVCTEKKNKAAAGGEGRIVVGTGGQHASRSGSGPNKADAGGNGGANGSNGPGSGGGAAASAGNAAGTPTSEGSAADRATPAATKKGK
ncbi:hypothetical protein HMPREF1624_05220 [Sporothrix schenckii ATCC 58251]|uniref:Chromatin modification-related protein n=1 Tax=Sporothrix schenckii (strain ATCC 58251 / de Perez 2211183) TaxID=1391915 RepID=U7PU40_SPOS1|nr:hypothetical protein HMPREF1624_05220 [Sporothrix schenckii ATCC 58251]